MIKNLIRALRLPFTSASILPYIFGSLLSRWSLDMVNFIGGLICVLAMHLSANLLNDYADSRSGADWHDKKHYVFFGGSKLIQEGILTEKFYLRAAIFFMLLSLSCVIFLAVRLQSLLVIIAYFVIVMLAWSYSMKPLKFSYRRCGEIIIFLLFGPALVMGGFFLQTKVFPDFKSFFLSLPFGFLTAAILFANEIPDYITDKASCKYTLVDLVSKERAFIFYLILVLCAFSVLVVSVISKFLGPISLLACIFFPLSFVASKILRKNTDDKIQYIQASQLTIVVQTMVSITLIFSALWLRSSS